MINRIVAPVRAGEIGLRRVAPVRSMETSLRVAPVRARVICPVVVENPGHRIIVHVVMIMKYVTRNAGKFVKMIRRVKKFVWKRV